MPPFSQLLRAPCWQLPRRTLHFGKRPLLMGIINATPDSFSDGGRFFDPQTAIARGLELVAAGADLLDIGGESTRPYSAPVSAEEELRRVLPVVQNLAQQCKAALSIDTSKSVVAQACLEAGAEIINDVTGLTGDPQMLPLAVKTGAAVCVMHMQGTPQTMQDDPHYANVTQDILQYLLQRRASLESVGIPRLRIALDPGIGFGKAADKYVRFALTVEKDRIAAAQSRLAGIKW